MKTLVSIHDVMPHTMQEVGELLRICREAEINNVTLLVVPGLDWAEEQLAQIEQWQKEGFELAAHGWHHKCTHISSLKHRLHSLLLSRNVAEHLCLKPDQIAQLMTRSGDWFETHNFSRPVLYVPPAWALGKISNEALAQTGFRMVETLTGVRFPNEGQHTYLPLVGFEADNTAREASLRLLNGAARLATKRRPLRVSLHPYDHKLRLRDSLQETLQNSTVSYNYTSLLDNANQLR